MDRATRLLLAFLLSVGAATVQPANRLMASPAEGPRAAGQPAQQATLKPAAAKAPDIPFDDDLQTEQQLLVLANQSRQQTGAPPLNSSLNKRQKTLRSTMMPSTDISI